jgi:hypothetical protein
MISWGKTGFCRGLAASCGGRGVSREHRKERQKWKAELLKRQMIEESSAVRAVFR